VKGAAVWIAGADRLGSRKVNETSHKADISRDCGLSDQRELLSSS